MEASKTRKPRPAANGDTAKMQKRHTDITASWLIREAVATIAIGAMLGVMFWQSVFGMADDFTSSPIIPIQMAMEAQSHGR